MDPSFFCFHFVPKHYHIAKEKTGAEYSHIGRRIRKYKTSNDLKNVNEKEIKEIAAHS